MTDNAIKVQNDTSPVSELKFKIPDKTKKERLFHAIMFETIALILCAPALALIMNKSLFTSASLTLMNAACAMVMNIVFNIIFDHFEKKIGFTKNFKVRMLHACLFEISLLSLIVPLGALLLKISLSASFAMNVGLIFFFLPYTYIYNLAFDTLRYKYYLKKFQTN
ncbi:PACE efflux transporter [Thorsellia kenyensis]|uniref:PACE efflux transporter n=1 Tax=Thorsellia kenyensis TaxID=1549888 RepID=A0ABV6C6S3_9GAMM